MLVHVDALGSNLGQLEGDFLDGLGRTDQGEDAAVVVTVGLRVEQGAAGNALSGLDEGVVGGLVLFLGAAKIGDAFDQLCHDCFPPSIYYFDCIVNLLRQARRARPFLFSAAIISRRNRGVNRFSFSFFSARLIFLSPLLQTAVRTGRSKQRCSTPKRHRNKWEGRAQALPSTVRPGAC